MNELRVLTTSGVLEGFAEDSVCKFLGIPYAAPPVGPLRWCAPRHPENWTGVREAKQFGAACVQQVGASFDLRVTEKSEDCLYLNVWTAALGANASQPVMVWIHGGGNLGGAGSEDAFDGSRLAAKGVTVVSINYRLGAFGFLAHPTLGANFAVLDQVRALTWVRDNIAGFGGNPNNVTIFGQSAGAVAVKTLLSCPMARNLFHRAILQSGGFEAPAFAPAWSYERAQAAAEKLFDRLGSNDPAVLRTILTEDVGRVSHELCGVFPVPGQVHTPANLVWMPVVDGDVVIKDDYAGWPPEVPVMMGCVENEARYFIKPAGTYPPEVLERMAGALCGPVKAQVLKTLAVADATPYEMLDRLFTSAIWFEPAHETIRKFAQLGRRFYYYHFNRQSPGSIANQDLAKHTNEIRYVFGTLKPGDDYDDVDRALSEKMQIAWIDFAKGGVPLDADGHPWPSYRDDDPQYTLIRDDIVHQALEVDEVIRLIQSIRTTAS